ncbi:hypothetical protein UK23_27395 [Lentzea aerocolonigenes]|uniref:Uncharacterized protein n=1 Tax=Lentzea aerocolonigenes TaxID=68170 RepID=A0A0F0GNG1_LENAE|nr:hypothetical protein [Lentzea aerocolonigenes]KJK45019.1 hypothetical protein UK23_27395 [Lentzea aerocolonigenes]
MHTPVEQRTPLAHCLFGASVWYVALLVAFGIAEVRTGTDAPMTLVAAVGGAVVLAISTTLLWALMRVIKARIEPTLMILVALPIFGVTWFALHVLLFVFAVAFLMPR